MYVSLYIYIEGGREGERERETETERQVLAAPLKPGQCLSNLEPGVKSKGQYRLEAKLCFGSSGCRIERRIGFFVLRAFGSLSIGPHFFNFMQASGTQQSNAPRCANLALKGYLEPSDAIMNLNQECNLNPIKPLNTP